MLSAASMDTGRVREHDDKQALVPVLMELTLPCERQMNQQATETQTKRCHHGAFQAHSGVRGRRVSWEVGHERWDSVGRAGVR